MAMAISLKQLRVFVAVTQQATLTAAADSLYISKAAVSMALSELEKHLGHALFDRVNNRLILNQEGKQLLPLADELLQRSQTIEHLFVNPQLNGQLRLGASDTIGNQVAPFLLSGFRQRYDHQDQRLFISNTALICQKLVDYELDIALVEGQSHHPDLHCYPFSQDAMCIITACNSALAKGGIIPLSELENQYWLLREAGSGTREFFLHSIAPRLQCWHETFQLNTTEAIINSVSAGLGIACLSKLAAAPAIKAHRVVSFTLPLDMQRRFWILVHKEKYQSPLLKTFIQFCQQWQK